MGLNEAVRSGFDHFSNWKGRASRPAYWYLVLAYIIAFAVPMILGSAIGGGLGVLLSIIALIVWLAFVIPLIGAAVRRLHDGGRSGWWYFITLVPLIGGIWLLVLLILEGDAGPNEYGPNPGSGVSEPDGVAAAPAAGEVPPAV